MPRSSWLSRGLVATCGVLMALGLVTVPEAAAKPAAPLTISVLSNRADLLSGGDALVAVALPDGVAPDQVRVAAGGRDVTAAFALRPDGRFAGLVDGLPVGPTELTATAGRHSGRTTVVNHPIGGPAFSGPQVGPWTCQPAAVDAQCNQRATFELRYRSSNPLEPSLKPFDPAAPPTDVAQATTDEGVTVPFVVRVETGYQARDQYKIATLYRPGEPWAPWSPQAQWNGKVLMTHGGGCGASYGAGEAPSVTSDNVSTGYVPLDEAAGVDSVLTALGRGFLVMSTALNNNGHNCNIVTQAESMTMAKEHVVETYGPIRYTIGIGCSGGALVQQQVSNAYPGIYQGLITTCSYPDTLSAGTQFADYHLLRGYFENPGKWGSGVLWSPTQMAAVEGHLSHANAITADEGLFKAAVDPAHVCNPEMPAEDRYHPQANPGGARCSILDYMINVLGPRPESVWSPMEREAGRGFAGIPLGNEGIQYGLEALRAGLITPAQFVDLNTAIGGLDVDIKPIAQRTSGDAAALRNVYRSGAINGANAMSGVAIINHGGPDPGAAHDYLHAFWTRARLEREQGHFRNHVMWFGATPLIGDPRYAKQALLAMDRWLTEVEADSSDRPLAEKIVTNRPADLVDRCAAVAGVELAEVPGLGDVCRDSLVQTKLGTPRTAAGDGTATGDITACTLKDHRRTDYPVLFTDAQWQRLAAAFPNGVCDWSKPGVGQADTETWLTYSDGAGGVVYGGTPMPPAPANSGAGWASSAFRELLAGSA